ncbi:hypothetical protein DPMN_152769 [Dreissena polymorpha]|uniref:Uncharacterized protein n=1 Tax=Dreissena polymorpha TaxID=45954 RepID=A0A9D4FHE3_DREPO|nr:hypothetical protein DPMN_152769 [Dreissena polymorpha]
MPSQLDIQKNCTTLYPNVELNVELECRASSVFENKHTSQYANAELNDELECRASSTFGYLNVELMSNVERRANFTHLI